jgi:hypothetical protein
MADAEAVAIERVKARTDRKEKGVCIYQLEQSEYFPIAFAVDAYLDAARRAQNTTSAYLSKVLRTSIPLSLNDLVSNLRISKTSLPERVSDLITSYWSQSGERLKAYRDLSQHHALVSSDGRVVLLPDDRSAVYLVLPNNPDVKDLAKLSYLDPRIDALPYAMQSYCELYAFILELTHLLLSSATDPGFMSFAMVFKGPIRAGGSHVDGHEPISVESLSRLLQEKTLALTKKLDAELPRAEVVPTLICEPARR